MERYKIAGRYFNGKLRILWPTTPNIYAKIIAGSFRNYKRNMV